MSVVKVLLLYWKSGIVAGAMLPFHHREALSFRATQEGLFYKSTTMLIFPHIAAQSPSDYITFPRTNTLN